MILLGIFFIFGFSAASTTNPAYSWATGGVFLACGFEFERGFIGEIAYFLFDSELPAANEPEEVDFY